MAAKTNLLVGARESLPCHTVQRRHRMPTQKVEDSMSIQAVVERAARDPGFLDRLAKEPQATIQAEGYAISPEEVAALLDVPSASDEEVAEALQGRLSHSSPCAFYVDRC
jgi:hypothetical protein